jgi:hypothetical protein
MPITLSLSKNGPLQLDYERCNHFSGLANFYKHFIKGFLMIAQPRIAFTHKEAPFEWTTVAQMAFDLLKQAFTLVLILLNLGPTTPFHVEMVSRNYARVLDEAGPHRTWIKE